MLKNKFTSNSPEINLNYNDYLTNLAFSDYQDTEIAFEIMLENADKENTLDILKESFEKEYLNKYLIREKDLQVDDYEFLLFLSGIVRREEIELKIFFDLLESVAIETTEDEKIVLMVGFLEGLFNGVDRVRRYSKYIKKETFMLLKRIFIMLNDYSCLKVLEEEIKKSGSGAKIFFV